MADLNLDLHYFEHPKTVRLVGLLGRGAEVLPIRLWAYCGKVHAESGKLANYSTRELESAIGWWGKEGEAEAAMVKVGFIRALDGAEAGFEAVDWLEHQGHLAAFKERSRRANEVRWMRAKKAPESPRSPPRSPKYDVKESSYPPTHLPNQRTTTGGAAGTPLDGFEAWYVEYPEKKARGGAERAWKALRPDVALQARMLAALKAQKAQRERDQRSGAFVPRWAYPATWINQKRWQDEATPSEAAAAGPGVRATEGKYSKVGEHHELS